MPESTSDESERAPDEHFVVRTLAVAGEIERHVAETVALAGLDGCFANAWGEQARKLVERNLDACDRVVEAHAHLAQTESAKLRFEAADLR